MDQCKHCICRGSIYECERTECDKHEYWYVQTRCASTTASRAQRDEAKRSIRLAIGMMQQGNFDAEDVAYVLEKSIAKMEAHDGK